MVRLDCQILKVVPVVVKSAAPAEHQAFDDHTAVQWRAKGIKNQSCVNREELEHAAHNLKGVCALMFRHSGINLGVHGGSVLTNLDENKVVGHEGHPIVSDGARQKIHHIMKQG